MGIKAGKESEPPIHINNFLQPLVDDLWKGVPLTSGGSQCVRAALLSVASDFPAIRKITQFLGHKADLPDANFGLNVKQALLVHQEA